MGPTPEEAVGQYHQAIGPQPIPAYWSIGFNLCRWSYNSIENMRATIDRNAAAGIPQVCFIKVSFISNVDVLRISSIGCTIW